MRYVSIREAQEGMLLAKPIIDDSGRILLGRSSALNQAFINKLDLLGVCGLYIEDKLTDDIEIEDPISPKLRNDAIRAVRSGDINSCLEVAKRIVDEIIKKGSVRLDLKDLRSYDNYTFEHSVSVGVLACTIGFGMKMRENELNDLVLAALLHDLGKTGIPEEVLNKPGRLTPEEFALIKAHPQMSYEIIKGHSGLSAITKKAVLSHHENYDGSGYPEHVSGSNIILPARILHVCDVYDALTSKRPYKDPYSPFAAVEILQGGCGTMYDPEIVTAFLKHVPIYPKGTIVEIDNNIRGIVVFNNNEHNLRPIVRLEDGTDFDLCSPENLHCEITNPADLDYIKVIEDETNRREMTKDLQKHKIMILDSNRDTYDTLSRSMSYLYDFQHVVNDRLAEGYIRKYGVPDLVIVDVDHRDLSNFDDLADKNNRMSSVVPVIVLGSFKDIKTISLFRNLGIRNYILKPYRLIYLQSEINRYISHE